MDTKLLRLFEVKNGLRKGEKYWDTTNRQYSFKLDNTTKADVADNDKDITLAGLTANKQKSTDYDGTAGGSNVHVVESVSIQNNSTENKDKFVERKKGALYYNTYEVDPSVDVPFEEQVKARWFPCLIR